MACRMDVPNPESLKCFGHLSTISLAEPGGGRHRNLPMLGERAHDVKPPICFLTYVKKFDACSYHRTVLRMITERIIQHLRRTTLSFRPHAEKRNGYRCREV